jgi:hypothetical protein
MEIMNLNENQVQIIDSLKTEFLRINETNKQHKVGTLIDFNQMASDKEEMRKKRYEDRAIGRANGSRCEEEFYKAIEVLNEDLKYVGLEFKRHLYDGLDYNVVKCKSYEIRYNIDQHQVGYGGYFKPEYHDLDTFCFGTRIMGEKSSFNSFETIEELANNGDFVQFVKRHGDFDLATINLSDQKEVSHG